MLKNTMPKPMISIAFGSKLAQVELENFVQEKNS
jgi:hypothetical protein